MYSLQFFNNKNIIILEIDLSRIFKINILLRLYWHALRSS